MCTFSLICGCKRVRTAQEFLIRAENCKLQASQCSVKVCGNKKQGRTKIPPVCECKYSAYLWHRSMASGPLRSMRQKAAGYFSGLRAGSASLISFLLSRRRHQFLGQISIQNAKAKLLVIHIDARHDRQTVTFKNLQTVAKQKQKEKFSRNFWFPSPQVMRCTQIFFWTNLIIISSVFPITFLTVYFHTHFLSILTLDVLIVLTFFFLLWSTKFAYFFFLSQYDQIFLDYIKLNFPSHLEIRFFHDHF